MHFSTFLRLKITKFTKFRAPKIAENNNFRISKFCNLNHLSNQLHVKKYATYHDPSPFKHGTSKGNGSCFCKSSLMIRSFGMSSVSMVSMSIVISPGIGTSSGEEPPKTCIGASSNPSTKSSK